LHPPLAAAMVLLAGVVPGTRLVDPFCGSGTIAIEARRWSARALAIGCDVARAALDDARRNVAAAGLDGIALAQADAARPPFARGFDRVVTNPPWGGQAPLAGTPSVDELPAVVRVMLDREGHAAVLLDESLDELRWPTAPSATIVVSLFGRHPRLLLFHPGAEPLPPGGLLAAELAGWHRRSADRRP
jgi:tRNA G10  N-methylase Trm11